MTISVVTKADSICNNYRITTFEWEYPRFIHSEVMTHRLLSRNAASSRAIPSKAMRKQVWNNPAMPIHWGKNQAGMQANTEVSKLRKSLMRGLWRMSGKGAVVTNKLMSMFGLHKQLANRVLEPWQVMKVVVTGTEWSNFLWLRNHSDAQPEIAELARQVDAELKWHEPKALTLGEWHLPYYNPERYTEALTLEDAKAVSASCCAQVSYRKLDGGLPKARRIYKMLINGKRVHASPFEHQATPIDPETTHGVTHIDMNQRQWSGNFCGWVQHRQLIPNHVKN